MGNSTELSKKLNNSIKQITTLLLVLAIAIPQNLFASNPAGGDGDKFEISEERLNFEKALTPQEMNQMGVSPDSIQTINTSSIIADQKVDIDIIRGEMHASEASTLVNIFKELEPEIRKALDNNPGMKFQFIYAGPESQKTMSVSAQAILDILRVINPTLVKDERVPDNLIAEYVELLHNFIYGVKHIFDKTTKTDVYWSLARVAGSGTAATLSFYYGSGIPIPASLTLGLGVIGLGSGTIGLFLEKFTGWLESNKVTPQNTRRFNKIGSIETYMFLSPLLIGFQETGLNSLAGAALIAGSATASVVVQNTYFFIKKKSPRAAMWYKWYATEALFLTAPFLVMPGWDIYSDNVVKAITGTFLTALMSTASQGVWDILLTDYIRKPLLQEAIRKDISNLAEKISQTPISDEKFSDLVLNHKNNHAEEFKVRGRFKKYFYTASVISVASAIAMTTGAYKNIEMLQIAGKSGLVVLGASGIATWAYLWIKRGGPSQLMVKLKNLMNREKSTKSRYEGATVDQLIQDAKNFPMGIKANSCSALFSI